MSSYVYKMMCSACNVKPATVYYTDVVNGVAHSRKFCVSCAQQIGLFNVSSFDLKSFDGAMQSLDNMMKSFDDIFKSMSVNQIPPAQDITCPDCGMTLSKFKQIGRFGCAKDYELFKVGPALEKIHGTSVHTGKVPEKSPDDKIKRLKKDMEAAVKAEQYEKAASIRDEIKKLETIK